MTNISASKRTKKKSVFYKPAGLFHPSARLFCFPYAGGAASSYSNWPSYFKGLLDILVYQPAGRSSRFTDKLNDSMESLIDDILVDFPNYIDIPYVIFGHSLGAKVAFELVCRLQEMGAKLPELLIVSGCQAPHLNEQKYLISELSQEALIDKLRTLNGTPQSFFENPELLELMLPVLRADFQIDDTYYPKDKKIIVPLQVFGGDDDKEISFEHLSAWSELTTQTTVVETFPGDHFFIHSQEKRVLASILNTVQFYLNRRECKT